MYPGELWPIAPQVEVLEDVKRLEKHGALGPYRLCVDFVSHVGRGDGVVEGGAVARKVVHAEQPADAVRAPRDCSGDVPPVEHLSSRAQPGNPVAPCPTLSFYKLR